MASGKPASGEDSLIARYFRPLATDPGAFGLDDDAAILLAMVDVGRIGKQSAAVPPDRGGQPRQVARRVEPALVGEAQATA